MDQVAHSRAHPLTHSLSHSVTQLLSRLLIHAVIPSFLHSCILLLTHRLAHLFMFLLIHPLIHTCITCHMPCPALLCHTLLHFAMPYHLTTYQNRTCMPPHTHTHMHTYTVFGMIDFKALFYVAWFALDKHCPTECNRNSHLVLPQDGAWLKLAQRLWGALATSHESPQSKSRLQGKAWDALASSVAFVSGWIHLYIRSNPWKTDHRSVRRPQEHNLDGKRIDVKRYGVSGGDGSY